MAYNATSYIEFAKSTEILKIAYLVRNLGSRAQKSPKIPPKKRITPAKTVSASASPVFFSKFCHPRRWFWAIIENMISPDHVLYYNFKNFQTIQNFGKEFQNLEFFSKISKTT